MYSPTKIRKNIESPSHFRKKKQKLNEKQILHSITKSIQLVKMHAMIDFHNDKSCKLM